MSPVSAITAYRRTQDGSKNDDIPVLIFAGRDCFEHTKR